MMKKRLIPLMVLVLMQIAALAQSQVKTDLTLESKILKKTMHYSVYLPPSYQESKRDYPVLYLLHGMTDDHTSWVIKGETQTYADEAITSGALPEAIIIFPDGLYDAFYINNYDESIRWEDFFYEEFIPEVENRFRIIKDRRFRSIAGLSMGGYGALYHSVAHQDLFTFCYAMSAAVLEREPVKEGEGHTDFGKAFDLKTWGPLNDEGLPTNYKKHSLHEMFKSMDEYKAPGWGQVGLPTIFIDCGDDDFLFTQNIHLIEIMQSKKVPVEFRVRNGGHEWDYWRSGLQLTFLEWGKHLRKI